MKKVYYYKINSENQVSETLAKAIKKINSYGANPIPITTALKNKIINYLPVFSGLIEVRNDKAREQAKCVRAKDMYILLTYKFNKYFIYALNGQIDLGMHPGTTGFRPEDRLYYGLGLNQLSLPTMLTESQILRVTNDVISGEITRTGDGGTPIALPTLLQITDNKTITDTKIDALIPAKEELNTAQSDVTESKAIGIDLYDELHDQLELAFRDLDDEKRRKLMREWGILYKEDTKTEEYVYGTITTDGSALDEVTIYFQEIDLTINNSDDGSYGTHQVPAGIYTVIFKRLHYNDVTISNFEVKHEIENLLNCEMTLHLG